MGEAEADAAESIVDLREDTLFCPMTGAPTALKTCYFLRPCYKESGVAGARVPHRPPVHAVSSSLLGGRSRVLSGKTKQKSIYAFHSKGWVEWVNLLEPQYGDTWVKAGIFDAIKCSTCRVFRDSGLLHALAEKWCPGTNTFVFSWGEATVTLEDVFVLGGYPVRGHPVFVDVEGEDMRDAERSMRLAKLELGRSPARNARSLGWMKMFKGSGSNIEHEAFLAFWLSRYVFVMPFARISVYVFPVATHLARGHKIALAPAVLASIYRDLSLASKCIHGLAAPSSNRYARVWLPSSVLQVWAWERFIFLQTTPKEIGPDKPRISRWDEVRSSRLNQVHMDLDMNISSYFEWRPYVKKVKNFRLPRFYPEGGRLVILDGDNLEDEIWAFARCLVPCELVGLDCIEKYLPHRVAMQFGMDQDVPGHVARCNENPTVAWESYDISFRNSSLYIPPRYYKPGVSERYRSWLGSRASGGLVRRSEEAEDENEDSFSPGFPPVPLGWNVGESNGEDDYENVTLSQLRSKTKKRNAGRSRASSGGGNLYEKNKGVAASQNPSPRDATTVFGVPLDEEQKGEIMPSNPTPIVAVVEEPKEGECMARDANPEEARVVIENDSAPAMNLICQQESSGRTAWGSRSTFEIDMLGLDLSARISKLERNVAAIKAARRMRRLAD